MGVMSESYNRHSAIDWGLFSAAQRRRYDSTFVELEDFTACADTGGDRSELHCHFELQGVMWKHVDEVCYRDLALSLISSACLWFASVWVVLGSH